MKKILSIELALCLIFSLIITGIPIQAQAINDMEISLGGSTSKVTYSQSANNEVLRFFSSSTDIVNEYIIPPEGSFTNYRLCFEISKATVDKTVWFDINKGSLKQVRMANSDRNGTNVVVELAKKPNYTLAKASDGKSLVLALTNTLSDTIISESGPITKNGPLSYSMSGDSCVITLNGISLAQGSTGSAPRFELREREKIIQITIPGKDTRFNYGILSGNPVIHGILVNYNENHNITSIRIPYTNAITYTHTVSNGSSIFKIKKSNTTLPGTPSPIPNPSVPPKPTPTSKTPAPETSSPTSPPSSSTDKVTEMVFNASSISVADPNFSGVEVYRLGDPSRIIVEYSGTAAIADKKMPSNSLYTRAVVTQKSTDRVRIQLYTVGMPEWTISQSTGKFTLNLTKNNITNVEAGDGDKTALKLVSPGIVSRFLKHGDKIILDDSDKDGTFTFMIPVDIVQTGNGTAKIESDLIKSVVSLETKQSSFILLHKTQLESQFKIERGASSDELLVKISESESSSPDRGSFTRSKLVVLDPGHGGSDPGGTVGTYFEKNYNLDIALRMEGILKSKGINVVMTRRSDVFVGLEERAELANNLNATIFLSIHNNIMPAKYKGSMTLYYPSSYDGKAYARIIQDNLVKDLGTGDIGLSARGDLVVIKKTKMPAVLAEVACISYPSDLALLNTDAFIQKAAESLADSVMDILTLK